MGPAVEVASATPAFIQHIRIRDVVSGKLWLPGEDIRAEFLRFRRGAERTMLMVRVIVG
jgi:hypothetical protein